MIDDYIQQYGRRLYGFCLFLCQNSFDADDLYQDTWLKVVKNFSKYNPSLDFKPWLTKICVNTYRNTLRKIARSPLLSFSNNDEKNLFFESIPAQTRKDYLPLYEAINHLPNKLRLTVILFYFRDMDIVSTAAILHIPSGTVKSRLNKARTLLKEALHDETDLRF